MGVNIQELDESIKTLISKHLRDLKALKRKRKRKRNIIQRKKIIN